MTPADLSAWRSQMAYTQRQAAAALGVTLATYQRLERGAEWTNGAPVAIDRRTALACAALAVGLDEWSQLAALRTKKNQANNLAGAMWEQSISQEMSAVVARYDVRIRAIQGEIERLQGERERLAAQGNNRP